MRRLLIFSMLGVATFGLVALGLYFALILSPRYMERPFSPTGVWSGLPELKSYRRGIRMDSVHVRIRLFKTKYSVDGVFDFFNTGNSTTEWVGFPVRASTWAGGTRPPPALHRFSTWVNDKSTPTLLDRYVMRDMWFLLAALVSKPFGVDYHAQFTQRITFSASTRTTLRVYYESQYLVLAKWLEAPYLLGGASSWGGGVGSTAFTIDGTAIGGTGSFGVRVPDRLRFQQKSMKDVMMINIAAFEPSPMPWIIVYLPDATRRSTEQGLRPR